MVDCTRAGCESVVIVKKTETVATPGELNITSMNAVKPEQLGG